MQSTNTNYILRFFCVSFQVRNAQNAGALAAIVYDDMYESLIIMSKPPNHADPLIPSCFITLRSGMLIRRLLELDFEARARIVPVGGCCVGSCVA